MATRTATIALVRSKLHITGTSEILSDTQIGYSVDEAVLEYSKDKPYKIADQFAGQDEYDYDIVDSLPSWITNFSVIEDIEYPAEDQTKDMLEDIDFEVYKPDIGTYSLSAATSGGTTVTLATAANALFFKDDNCVYIQDGTSNEVNWVNGDGNTTTGVVTLKNALAASYTGTGLVSRREFLRFNFYSPGTNEIVRAIYTTKHTLSDSSDTIPATDYEAVVSLASGISAMKIAGKFAKQSESSISADSVDHLDKSREWKDMADWHIKFYKDHMGIVDGKVRAASATKDQDLFFQWGGDYLFHPRRWR